LKRDIGLKRLALACLLLLTAFGVAINSWSLPVIQAAEFILYDIRSSLNELRLGNDPDRESQNSDIVILAFDEMTAFRTSRFTPHDRDILTKALNRIDGADPKAIGIDILIDQPSPDDAELLQTLQNLQSPTFLAFVEQDAGSGSLWWDEEVQQRGSKFQDSFHAQLTDTKVKKVNVEMPRDGDNVLRRWTPQKNSNNLPLALAMAENAKRFQDYAGPLVTRTTDSDSVFETYPVWQVADPQQKGFSLADLRDKYVLIGGMLPGTDQVRTPLSNLLPIFEKRPSISGIEAHAHMLAQVLENDRRASIGFSTNLLLAMFVSFCAIVTAIWASQFYRLWPLIAGQIVIIFMTPIFLENLGYSTLDFPAFGHIILWFASFGIVISLARSVGAEKREFVQGALGQYLPKAIAAEIIQDPAKLELQGEEREIYALFTDLEGFTKLTHAIQPDETASLLNDYLQLLSETVLKYGGTIDKFVGDAVIAFWGAPIAKPDDADQAALCAIAMWEAGEKFRKEASDDIPPIGKTRVGLHRGHAVVGNFGGRDRIQYTALGDAMNTAARLESANKQTASSILVSREAMKNVSAVAFRPLGRVTLSGRSTPVEIFEPVRPENTDFAETLATMYDKFDSGQEDKRKDIRKLAEKLETDIALQKLVERIETLKPGESYVFRGK